jgi:exopolysaccharide biosynthesis polyprenyl glycosylphosphotransferase
VSTTLFRRKRALLILLLDIAWIVGCFSAIYYLRLGKLPRVDHFDLWLIAATFLITLFLGGTYIRSSGLNSPRLPIRTFFVALIGGLMCIFVLYLRGPLEFNNFFGRGVLTLGTIGVGIGATLIRYLVNAFYHISESNTELLYLGYSEHAELFVRELENHSEVRTLYFATNQRVNSSSSINANTLEPDTKSWKNRQWNGVIIDPSYHPNDEETSALVDLRLRGVPVSPLPDYYESHWYMVPVENLKKDWFLHSEGFSMLASPIALGLKRTIDITLALIILLFSAPIILLCIIAIKLDSRGPALFRQQRIGEQSTPFTIIKLRTMSHDAEKDGAAWASQNDPRITRVGNFMRKTRLDELPQCWNVLKGEMSFVGPRPEQIEFTQQLEKSIPYYNIRHVVKPGITGWAQVLFPYGGSEEDALKKLQYELYYIKNQSLALDLNIMIRTALTVFQRAGR